MLLEGRRLLITGVLDTRSIAFHVARLAQHAGAQVVLTSFGRALRITRTAARRLPAPAEVLELDVTRDEDIAAVAAHLDDRWGGLDGVLHAVAFAPPSCLGGRFLTAPWPDVATTLEVSTYSLARLARGLLPVLERGQQPSIVALDFDATTAWPGYDWMGVAKAGLEACARYLAAALGPRGVRVNLVAAGPLHTTAARGIDGFEGIEDHWARRAPLGWDSRDPTPVARAVCVLLSGWLDAVTGEVLHVDGGAHAVAVDGRTVGGATDLSVAPPRSR